MTFKKLLCALQIVCLAHIFILIANLIKSPIHMIVDHNAIHSWLSIFLYSANINILILGIYLLLYKRSTTSLITFVSIFFLLNSFILFLVMSNDWNRFNKRPAYVRSQMASALVQQTRASREGTTSTRCNLTDTGFVVVIETFGECTKTNDVLYQGPQLSTEFIMYDEFMRYVTNVIVNLHNF